MSLRKLKSAAKRFEAAEEALRAAAFAYAKQQTLALSRALPSRTIEYVCGMETISLTVSARDGDSAYQLSSGGWTGTEQRICAVLGERLKFISVLDEMEADYRLPDIGGGGVTARNGAEVKQ